jgi:Sugar phosphate isomerases/epimerases
MDFGMPVLLETPEIEDCVRLCKSLDLRFIELNSNLPEYQPDVIDIEKLKTISREENIYFTIHFDENLNVCDFNRRVADAYLDTVARTIAVAKQLAVPILNMHLSDGVYFTMPTEKIYLYNRYVDQYLAQMRNFRELCEKQIGDAEMKICVENTRWSGLGFMQRAIDVLLESKVFGLTFDLGHNYSTGGGDEALIRDRVGRLYHMHAHDAAGEKNHLALGTGEMDVKPYLELARQHNCRVVLETKTVDGLKQSCAWVANHFGGPSL